MTANRSAFDIRFDTKNYNHTTFNYIFYIKYCISRTPHDVNGNNSLILFGFQLKSVFWIHLILLVKLLSPIVLRHKSPSSAYEALKLAFLFMLRVLLFKFLIIFLIILRIYRINGKLYKKPEVLVHKQSAIMTVKIWLRVKWHYWVDFRRMTLLSWLYAYLTQRLILKK